MALARIGLGSNAGDAAANIERAAAALATLGRVAARSSLYRTKPWGPSDQPDFVNAALLLETELSPRALLVELKRLETELGRVVTYRWGPRVIDLDILAYDDVQIDEPDLAIPHPRLPERAFALVPLAEIDPAFGPARDALPAAEREAVQRIPARAARTRTNVNWDETLQRVRMAAAFCAAGELARFRVEEPDLSIEVRRSPRVLPAAAPAPPAENGSKPATAPNGSAPRDARQRSVVKAEFVGIVRLSRPSVAPGTVLGEDRELAYVESLGIRNPVRSGGPGRVTEILVTDGEPVEYGQPLFSIEK
jgi:2-amino-4-hydroxy-6-hydroxymethyldihydropteridine diphosphokinase